MTTLTPTKEQAYQFAVMITSGMPSRDAIRYFLPEDATDENFVVRLHDSWARSREVQAAANALMGKSWTDMTTEEKIRYAIDKHYAEMAYFLYSHNYAEVGGIDKQKADTCRAALEAKLAGMAGKMDVLSQFYADVMGGKVKLSGRPS